MRDKGGIIVTICRVCNGLVRKKRGRKKPCRDRFEQDGRGNWVVEMEEKDLSLPPCDCHRN